MVSCNTGRLMEIWWDCGRSGIWKNRLTCEQRWEHRMGLSLVIFSDRVGLSKDQPKWIYSFKTLQREYLTYSKWQTNVTALSSLSKI